MIARVGRSSSTAAACALTLSIACAGADDGRGGTDSGAPVPVEAFASELAAAVCHSISECFASFANTLPMEECRLGLEGGFRNGSYARLEASVAAGRVAYDAGLAAACLRAFEAAGCEVYRERNFDVCTRALRGRVPLGGACDSDRECEGSAICDPSGICPRICKPLRGAGQFCEDDRQCTSGLNCDGLICGARARAGEACEGPDAPPCQYGFLCARASDTARGTCVLGSSLASRREGEPCNLASYELCEPGLSCVVETAGASSCRQKATAGGPCRPGVPEPCADGEYCDAERNDAEPGRCTLRPRAGEACGPSPEPSIRCAAGLVCVDGFCVSRKDNGAPCGGHAECHGNRCAAGRCEAPELCTSE